MGGVDKLLRVYPYDAVAGGENTPPPVFGSELQRKHHQYLDWLRAQNFDRAFVDFVANLPNRNLRGYCTVLEKLSLSDKFELQNTTSRLCVLWELHKDPRAYLAALDRRRVDTLTTLQMVLGPSFRSEVPQSDLTNILSSAYELSRELRFSMDVIRDFSGNVYWARAMRGIWHDLNNLFSIFDNNIELTLLYQESSNVTGLQRQFDAIAAVIPRYTQGLLIPFYPFHQKLIPEKIVLTPEFLESYYFLLKSNKRLHEVVRIEGTLPPLVADRYLLGSALINMVNNAFIHGKPFVDEDGQNYVVLGFDAVRQSFYIKDAGKEILPDDLKKIGTFGFQAKGEEGNGSGIGVYNIKNYMARMGGGFELRQIPGKGTFSFFRLPLHTEDASVRAAADAFLKGAIGRIEAIPRTEARMADCSAIPYQQGLIAGACFLHNQIITQEPPADIDTAVADANGVLSSLNIPDNALAPAEIEDRNPYPDAAELALFNSATHLAIQPFATIPFTYTGGGNYGLL